MSSRSSTEFVKLYRERLAVFPGNDHSSSKESHSLEKDETGRQGVRRMSQHEGVQFMPKNHVP